MFFTKLAAELDTEGFTVIMFSPVSLQPTCIVQGEADGPSHPQGYVKTDMNGGVDGPAALFKEDSVALT